MYLTVQTVYNWHQGILSLGCSGDELKCGSIVGKYPHLKVKPPLASWMVLGYWRWKTIAVTSSSCSTVEVYDEVWVYVRNINPL